MARSSRLKAEYFCSASVNFFEKNAKGYHIPLWHCCKTAPAAKSEASTCNLVAAVDEGWASEVAFASAALAASNALTACWGHSSLDGVPALLGLRRAVTGAKREAALGIKRW